MSMLPSATARISPHSDGGGRPARPIARSSAGYGISVIPLQFVSAQTLMKLLDGLRGEGGTACEPSRN